MKVIKLVSRSTCLIGEDSTTTTNGYVSFYVHLDHSLISNGIFVHKGDPTGVEGYTGAAGHRHLHWSIQKLPGSTRDEWTKHISWARESVPLQFKASQNGAVKTFEAASVVCAHAGIAKAESSEQSRFKGVQ